MTDPSLTTDLPISSPSQQGRAETNRLGHETTPANVIRLGGGAGWGVTASPPRIPTLRFLGKRATLPDNNNANLPSALPQTTHDTHNAQSYDDNTQPRRAPPLYHTPFPTNEPATGKTAMTRYDIFFFSRSSHHAIHAHSPPAFSYRRDRAWEGGLILFLFTFCGISFFLPSRLSVLARLDLFGYFGVSLPCWVIFGLVVRSFRQWDLVWFGLLG